MNENDSELCGRVFKIEYTDHKQRLVYLRLYSGTLHLRDTIILPIEKESETYRNIYSFKWGNDTDKNSLFWRYFYYT